MNQFTETEHSNDSEVNENTRFMPGTDYAQAGDNFERPQSSSIQPGDSSNDSEEDEEIIDLNLSNVPEHNPKKRRRGTYFIIHTIIY
jgi:hypothetical protein